MTTNPRALEAACRRAREAGYWGANLATGKSWARPGAVNAILRHYKRLTRDPPTPENTVRNPDENTAPYFFWLGREGG